MMKLYSGKVCQEYETFGRASQCECGTVNWFSVPCGLATILFEIVH